MKTLFLPKKIIVTILLFIAVTLFLGLPEITNAQQVTNCTAGDVACESAVAAVEKAKAGVPATISNLGLTSWRLDIFHLFSGLGAIIAWLGGILLDTSIGWFTIDMVGTVQYFGLDISISLLWAIIRDIFNIFFIFGLIFAGFKIILNANDSSAKKTIGGIVVAALLINFSLYVTQVVVDFSNVAAYQIYNLIDSGQTTTVLGREVKSLSSNFTNATDISSLNANGSQIMKQSGISDNGGDSVFSAFLYGFLFLLFYTILGFVFAAGAFLLFTRFFVLIFLMIFSPVMFLGFVFPNFAKYSRDWGGKLINQALMGPAYLFMLYLSLYALRGINNMQQYDAISVIIYLLVVTAFLWASLLVAKHFGGYGASAAVNIGQRWGKGIRSYATAAAGGASFGLVARGGRYFVGKRANEYAESDAAKDAAANSGWGRMRLNLARRLGDSSFDARSVGGFGKNLGIGEGIKGYATRAKEIEDREKKYGDSLGTVSDDDPQVARYKAELEATDLEIKSEKKRLQELRQSLSDTNLSEEQRQSKRGEIEATRSKIEDLEDSKNKTKESYTAEQQRRQLGSRSYIRQDTVEKLDKIKKDEESYIKTLPLLKKQLELEKNEEYKVTIQSQIDATHQKIAQIKKEKAEIQKKADTEAGGYATTVAYAGAIKNLFTGSNSDINSAAAQSIREEYQKKIKGGDKTK